MRMGACAIEPEQVYILKRNGYDFFDFAFHIVHQLTDKEFEAMLTAVKETGLRGEGALCFADPPMCLYDYTLDEMVEYLESHLPRAKQLGMQYLVIGSGGARRIPDGMSYDAATKFFISMLKRYAPIAEREDFDIIIEPLYSAATNFITTFAEALEICKAVDHPRVGLLMDFFHSYKENEPFAVMKEAGDYLKHIHLSALDRRIPVDGDEEETHMLANILKEIGYRGRITLEGNAQVDFDAETLAFSKQFHLFD